MRIEPIDRLGLTDQYRLDEWFDKAINDDSVRPYLTTGSHTPRIMVPDDDHDGVVLMNYNNTGVLKLYFEEESRTAKFGIWVLTPTPDVLTRKETAYNLMKYGINVCKQNPLIEYIGSRVMETNVHGLSFSSSLLDQWGTEPAAVFDTGTLIYNQTHTWVAWHHFRSPINVVEERLNSLIERKT